MRREDEAKIFDCGAAPHPVVFANGLDFTQMTYYCSPEARARAWTIAEPTLVVEPSPWKIAVIDDSLLAVQPLFPMQLASYEEFISRHGWFILCANDDETEWLTEKLLQDGHVLTLLATRSITRIYEVVITAR